MHAEGTSSCKVILFLCPYVQILQQGTEVNRPLSAAPLTVLDSQRPPLELGPVGQPLEVAVRRDEERYACTGRAACQMIL